MKSISFSDGKKLPLHVVKSIQCNFTEIPNRTLELVIKIILKLPFYNLTEEDKRPDP